MFYVYEHIRLDTQTPFYVGKGTGKRYKDLVRRNQYHKSITNKHGCRVNIVAHFAREQEAFTFERKLIELYKNFGYCEANFTLGGEGSSGYNHTTVAKQKISERSQKLWSDACHREHVSELHKKKWKNPKYAQNIINKTQHKWKDETFRAMHAALLKSVWESRLDLKKAQSKLSKKWWTDKNYRKKVEERSAKAVRKYHAKPFYVWEAEGKRNNYTKGKLLGKWDNQVTCARDLGLDSPLISHCLLGRRKTHKRYIFEYLGDI